MQVYVKLSNGREMTLEDLVMDYERRLQEDGLKKAVSSEPKAEESTVSKQLKVGKWFRIDRDVITKNREKIHQVCNEVGDVGKEYWKRFEESNQIASGNPDQYSRIIETYIFEHSWDYKTEQEMRDMCEKVGKGMCDEIICDLELQMRICNGESAIDLFKKADKFPRVRVIKLRNGGTGYFGGGAKRSNNNPPAYLFRYYFSPNNKNYIHVPYAFRRVLS